MLLHLSSLIFVYLQQLTGEKTTADKAAAILEEYFCGSVRGKKKRQNIVLLADEVQYIPVHVYYTSILTSVVLVL